MVVGGRPSDHPTEVLVKLAPTASECISVRHVRASPIPSRSRRDLCAGREFDSNRQGVGTWSSASL